MQGHRHRDIHANGPVPICRDGRQADLMRRPLATKGDKKGGSVTKIEGTVLQHEPHGRGGANCADDGLGGLGNGDHHPVGEDGPVDEPHGLVTRQQTAPAPLPGRRPRRTRASPPARCRRGPTAGSSIARIASRRGWPIRTKKLHRPAAEGRPVRDREPGQKGRCGQNRKPDAGSPAAVRPTLSVRFDGHLHNLRPRTSGARYDPASRLKIPCARRSSPDAEDCARARRRSHRGRGRLPGRPMVAGGAARAPCLDRALR